VPDDTRIDLPLSLARGRGLGGGGSQPWPTPAEAPDARLPLRRSALDSVEPPPPRCALTVDLEDWFHGLDLAPARWASLETRAVASTTRLLDLLAANGVRATFFILGRIAEAHPELVERILADGHEVGSHGHDHQFVYRQTRDSFARDLDASLAALRRAGAPDVASYRAPYFSITRRSLWALDLLAAAGITRDSSIMPARNPRYGIASAPLAPHLLQTVSGRSLLELPVSCLEVGSARLPFGGGFYLRFLPLALIRAAIRHTLRQDRPVVFYVHPWELDPAQPRLKLPAQVAATRYYRLGSTTRKLTALLQELRWTTLAEVAASCQPVPARFNRREGPNSPPTRPAPA
jgi:polysaccharide deacetylase family protein (PEP-CTERM system associated)